MPSRRRRIVLASLVALIALPLGACGSSSSSNTSSSSSAAATPAPAPNPGGYGGGAAATTTAAAPAAGASTVTLSADPSGALAFVPAKLTAKAGSVTLDMKNPSGTGTPHGIAIQGNGVDKDGPVVQPGGDSKVTVTLKPGTYSFYCPVPGHKAGGMVGTLTVS